ncbi:MAG: ABC transporter ATP-binding protein [Polyangiaceae bacterium]|nr:ABC transporter ATP-binding protein [Polyangiaceae bacterium]
MGLVWKSARGGTVGLGAATLFSALLPLAVAYVGKRIIDAVVEKNDAATLRWVVLELAVVAVLALNTRILALVRTIIGARLGVDINLEILEKAQNLELSHFEDPEFYDQLTRARREASSRPLSVVTGVFQIVQYALTLVGYGGLLLNISGVAVVGLVLAALPATYAEMRFSTSAFRMRSFRAPETRRLAYIEFLLGSEGNAKEMMTFGLGPTFLGRYRDLAETIYREDRALAIRRAGWGFVLSLLALGVFYGFYAFVAREASRTVITIGNLTLYVVAFRQGQQAFQSLLSTLGGMFEDNLYMSNLFAYLAIPTREPAKVEEGAEVAAHAEPGIVFEDVGFRYPGKDEWALRHVNLRIRKGERLALVGENGSGKTTFIKLLTRLYDPTEGRIVLDGLPLAAYDAKALRKRIGVIFQDFVRYQLSLSENVGVGSVEHLDDRPRVESALERGGADELPKTLKGGLDASLGRWFNREGAELSGGQWQRVALSRAFMREDADILVLDEPTSALDAEAEQAIFERFQELSKGKTTLLISHRFPTVRTADRIIVLSKGEIVEEGSHEELLKKDGRYRHLFQLQAKGYL